jgi:DNA-binding GntR family transcriptional regulator
MIETAAGYAATVLEFRGTTISDLFEAAAALEGPCAAMLARSRTTGQLERLRMAAEAEAAMRDDPQRLLELENDFHRLMIDMAGNATLRVLCEMVRVVIDAATRRYLAGTRAEALWRTHIRATAVQVKRPGGPDMVFDVLR